MKRHHKFLKRCIAGPLSDAIDRALKLTGAVLHGFQEVGHGQAKVVMAMHRDHRFGDVGDMLIDASDQTAELNRRCVADGVWNIDCGGPRSDGRLNHFVEKLRVASTRVFAGKFNVLHQRPGVADHVRNDGQHLGAAFAQLVFEMDIAGGNECMNAMPRRRSNSIRTSLDVLLRGTSQTADDGSVLSSHLLGNTLHRSEIALAGEWKTRLDHVHTEPRKLLGDRQLLLKVEACPWRLLTIPESGVENQDATGILGHNDVVSAGLVGMTMSCPSLVQVEGLQIGLHSALLRVIAL